MLGRNQQMNSDLDEIQSDFISQGLYQLVQSQLQKKNPQISKEQKLKIFAYCSRILSSRFTVKNTDVQSLVQKKLLQSSATSASRFAECIQKLRDLETIKNTNGILLFMLGLSNRQTQAGDVSMLKFIAQQKAEEKFVAPQKDNPVPKASVFNEYYKSQKEQPVTERDLIRDLIFAFQAIDGRIIRFDAKTDRFIMDKYVTFSD
jgi:hypothetical protein